MISTTDVKCRLTLSPFWWLGLLCHEGRRGGQELNLPTHICYYVSQKHSPDAYQTSKRSYPCEVLLKKKKKNDTQDHVMTSSYFPKYSESSI